MMQMQPFLVVTVFALYCLMSQTGVDGVTMAGEWFQAHIKCNKCVVKPEQSEQVRRIKPNIKNMKMMAKMLKVLLPYKTSSHTKKLRNRFITPRVG